MILKFKKIIAVTIIALTFTACKKTTSGTQGSIPSTADCKACAYTPDCSNMTLVYQDSLVGSSSTTRTITYTSVSDTTIGGVIFQKLTSAAGNAYQNCDTGVTTTIAYNLTSVSGTATLAAIKLVPLKANAAIGATWTDHVTNPAGEDVEYDYTIAEKGISRTVLGVTFTDVIHVSVPQTVTVPGIGSILAGQSEYYYAKDVGCIEADLSAQGSLYEITYLKSYNIPQ